LIWEINPFATVFSLVPIYLIYSTLQVPALQRQTEIDPKTKLYNARYFAEALKKELDRAERFDRPLTVVIGDLDLLRNINNTYGHLAGDVVLIGVAEILQNHFRGYDLVARFGGEEFAILLPEITPGGALPRVEAVRQAIEMADFNVSTSVTPIKATISFGIAERDAIQKSADQIIHDADVALYQAKLKGRNATCVHSTEGIEGVFGKDGRERTLREDLALVSRLEASEIPTQVNPLRQQATEKTVQPQKKAVKKRKSNPLWWVNAYIGALALVALGLITFTFKIDPLTDWFGLGVFALLILLTEGLSIDLYVNDTSISTATAPLIAGSLLYGPEGALILSLTLAATAMIKHRSQIIRFIFNASNHFISSSLCAFLIILSGVSFTAQSAYVRLAFAVLAGILIYFVSTLLLTGVLSLSMEQPFRRVWCERFRWLLPYYIAFGVAGYVLILGYSAEGILGLGAVIVPLLMLRFSQTQYVENTKSMVSQLRKQNFELENQSNEISSLNEDLLISLANVIDLRDTATRGHSEGVAHFAVLIGEELGLSPEHIERIRKSGLLHDIGKIGIPDAILFKPNALTGDEYEIVKQHPVRGAEILITNKSLRNLSPIIRHHHERYDGGGYPDGLAGHDIPLEARILNLADSLQAMCSNRPYRRALRLPEIISEITENAGTQFDPRVVKAFLDGLPRIEAKLSATIARSQSMDEPEVVQIVPADQSTGKLGRLRMSY
jgi:diguanylate cyclase (GGDEF)-like protein